MKNFPDNIEELYKTLKSYPELKNKQCRASFDGYFKSIEQIHSFNKETKYKIVFIGEPGRGKTTAICNWLSLLKTEKIDQPNIDSISLLAASSGRSTVAEVHIKQVSTKSRIYIEYMPKDIQQEYIKEYCNSYYTQALDIKDETDCLDSEENAELQHHSEIDRVIFNMAQPILEKIPSNILADEESIKTKEKIKKDISEFKNQSEFYQFILDIIDIDNRKLQEIFLPPNENFENWLRNNFYDINNGNNKQCSIPNKIYIDINIDDLNMELPDYVCEIIDTMGLDSNVRPDLQELLKADDTICFIMDELTKVPSQNIVSLINSSLQNDWDKKYCPNKISIFVRASDETLSAVMDAEGDAEKGKEIKQAELERKIKIHKVPYIISNTLFIDSISAYIKKYKQEKTTDPTTGKIKASKKIIIADFDREIAQSYRDEISDKINEIIINHKKNLQEDAIKIRDEIDSLIQTEQKLEKTAELEALKEAKENILKLKSSIIPKAIANEIKENILKKIIDDVHWARIKKTNSIFGNWEKDNIYNEIAQQGTEYFSQLANQLHSNIKKNLSDINNNNAKIIINGYIHKLECAISDSTDSIRFEYYDSSQADYFYPQSSNNIFWQTVQHIKGRGYKKNVRQEYDELLEEFKCNLSSYIDYELKNIFNNFIDSFSENGEEEKI